MLPQILLLPKEYRDAVGLTHSESVHLYRLIQDLLKEHDNSEEQALKAVEHYSSLKKLSVVVIVLLVVSLGLSAASFIHSLGIF